MPLRSRVVARWGLWATAWLAAVFGLLLILPARPTHCIARTGRLYLWNFVTDRTAIAVTQYPGLEGAFHHSGPIVFLDLVDGTIKTIPLPDDSLAAQGTLETSEQEQAALSGWRLSRLDFSGDFLVFQMVQGEFDRRLHVWNWRTGKELFRRSIPACLSGVLGNRIWIQSSNRASSEAELEFLEIPSGKRIPTALAAHQVELSTVTSSPDGRFVAEEGESQVRIWSIEQGREAFVARDAVRFAFSADSRWLATISDWNWKKAESDRDWRIYDVGTGTIVAHRHEVGDRDAVRRHSAASMTFHRDNQCVAVYSHSPIFRQGSFFPIGLGPVEIWDWQTGRAWSVPVTDGELWSPDYRGSFADLPTPRLVLDGHVMIDVATGQRLATMTESMRSHLTSPAPGWAIVEDNRRRFGDQVADVIAPISSRLAKVFTRNRRQLQLYDVPREVVVAQLGKDRGSFEFSPDNLRLISHDGESVDVWDLPPGRPVVRAFLWSLLVPLVGGFAARVRSSRRPRGDDAVREEDFRSATA